MKLRRATRRAARRWRASRRSNGECRVPIEYGLHRQIVALGHPCMVVTPSLIPKRPGARVKTNRRDAVTVAK